jgi:hypothetical protein
MATQKELEQRLAQLETELAALKGGERERAPGFVPPEQRRDYIEFGSDEHLAFLGLEKVADVEQAEKAGYTVLSSLETGQTYRLIDEMGAVQKHPGIDPDKAIKMVLRQKMSSFESGPPRPFPGAPPRFNPEGEPEFTPLN